MIDKSLLYDHEVTSVSQSFTHSVFEQKKKTKTKKLLLMRNFEKLTGHSFSKESTV